jgi:CheY-like chemotaxis protein
MAADAALFKPSMVLAKPLSRILYVDDDASMRELVRTALAGQAELSVVTCASGFEALIIVGQQRPDLILMDVAMPRMDGAQTLECLRAMELGHHTPVVFVAAGLAPPELRRLQAAGAVDVIPLPFEASKLAELIRSIWERIAD